METGTKFQALQLKRIDPTSFSFMKYVRFLFALESGANSTSHQQEQKVGKSVSLRLNKS